LATAVTAGIVELPTEMERESRALSPSASVTSQNGHERPHAGVLVTGIGQVTGPAVSEIPCIGQGWIAAGNQRYEVYGKRTQAGGRAGLDFQGDVQIGGDLNRGGVRGRISVQVGHRASGHVVAGLSVCVGRRLQRGELPVAEVPLVLVGQVDAGGSTVELHGQRRQAVVRGGIGGNYRQGVGVDVDVLGVRSLISVIVRHRYRDGVVPGGKTEGRIRDNGVDGHVSIEVPGEGEWFVASGHVGREPHVQGFDSVRRDGADFHHRDLVGGHLYLDGLVVGVAVIVRDQEDHRVGAGVLEGVEDVLGIGGFAVAEIPQEGEGRVAAHHAALEGDIQRSHAHGGIGGDRCDRSVVVGDRDDHPTLPGGPAGVGDRQVHGEISGDLEDMRCGRR
jgi:hypothetical protein